MACRCKQKPLYTVVDYTLEGSTDNRYVIVQFKKKTVTRVGAVNRVYQASEIAQIPYDIAIQLYLDIDSPIIIMERDYEAFFEAYPTAPH